MLLLTRFMIVVAYTFYFSKKAHQKKDHIGVSLGKCMVMMLSMTTSLTLSLMLSFLLPGKLVVLTVLAIAICAVAGFIIGRPFGLISVMESQSTTLMGAVMGAMLGVMLPLDSQTFMLVSMDLITLPYILCDFLYKKRGYKRNKKWEGICSFHSDPLVFHYHYWDNGCLGK
ncbi:hypothetical protein M3699_27665 [Peribacillus simplex]|uniref:hypothetical protein n=1 Tax=Peribacillus simplex TaxID=1478 RepID=UPI00203A6BC9|nr:hypothetical protein [Peribacillus simplex]MCM3677442.1 hypothetical protein [Peribacillus simplex]